MKKGVKFAKKFFRLKNLKKINTTKLVMSFGAANVELAESIRNLYLVFSRTHLNELIQDLQSAIRSSVPFVRER